MRWRCPNPCAPLLTSSGAVGVNLLDKAPGGVRVDATLRAATDVWAAGDIAYFPYAHGDAAHAFTRIEHWDVAMDQGPCVVGTCMLRRPHVALPGDVDVNIT